MLQACIICVVNEDVDCMKGFETYIAIMVVAGMVIAAIFLLGASGMLTGKESITASMAGELAKAGSGGCGSDADCKGNGVCIGAKCVCFDDTQCSVSCDKSVGKCTSG